MTAAPSRRQVVLRPPGTSVETLQLHRGRARTTISARPCRDRHQQTTTRVIHNGRRETGEAARSCGAALRRSQSVRPMPRPPRCTTDALPSPPRPSPRFAAAATAATGVNLNGQYAALAFDDRCYRRCCRRHRHWQLPPLVATRWLLVRHRDHHHHGRSHLEDMEKTASQPRCCLVVVRSASSTARRTPRCATAITAAARRPLLSPQPPLMPPLPPMTLPLPPLPPPPIPPSPNTAHP